MPRLRFLRPSTGPGLEKRGIHPPIWPFIGRFYCLRLFAWLLLVLISASLITASDGKRYNTNHYSLRAIIAVGFKVNNERAVQFRKWANAIVKDYTIKGWVMDEERLKNGGTVLTEKYFEEQLEKIREIRLSERKFYQKITDIYATALDYDRTAKTTKEFFAKVQNKMHFAVHGHTAAEVVYYRANADQPLGKIMKSDVSIAKNYLTEDELYSLERIVSAYLDLAEDRARRHIPMTMEDWAKRLDIFLKADDREILTNAGAITAEIAKAQKPMENPKRRLTGKNFYGMISNTSEVKEVKDGKPCYAGTVQPVKRLVRRQ